MGFTPYYYGSQLRMSVFGFPLTEFYIHDKTIVAQMRFNLKSDASGGGCGCQEISNGIFLKVFHCVSKTSWRIPHRQVSEIGFNWALIRHFRSGSMSNRRQPDEFCYQGIEHVCMNLTQNGWTRYICPQTSHACVYAISMLWLSWPRETFSHTPLRRPTLSGQTSQR